MYNTNVIVNYVGEIVPFPKQDKSNLHQSLCCVGNEIRVKKKENCERKSNSRVKTELVIRRVNETDKQFETERAASRIENRGECFAFARGLACDKALLKITCTSSTGSPMAYTTSNYKSVSVRHRARRKSQSDRATVTKPALNTPAKQRLAANFHTNCTIRK